MTEKINAFGYARCSTEEQKKQGLSIPQQVDTINKLCALKGWKLKRIFKDEAKSGAFTEGRSDLKAMMRAALNGECDVVVARHLDRLARSPRDLLDMVERLKEKGVAVAFNEPSTIDTLDKSYSEFFLTVLAAVAQLHRNYIRESTLRGKEIAFTQMGRAAYGGGSRTYGWLYDKEQKGLVQVPEEIKAVRRIFELVLMGKSFRVIAKDLNDKGFPTKFKEKLPRKKGGRKQKKERPVYWWQVEDEPVEKKIPVRWAPGTIQEIIFNTIYSRPTKLGNMENTAVVIGDYPFSVEYHNRVIQMASNRKNLKPRMRHSKRLLQGLLSCYECGSSCTVTWGKSKGKYYGNYFCTGANQGLCDTGSISANKLEPLFWKTFIYDMFTGVMIYFQTRYRPHNHANLAELEGDKRDLERRIGAKQEEMERLYTLGYKGEESKAMFDKMLAKLEKETRKLKERLLYTERKIDSLGDQDRNWERVKRKAEIIQALSERVINDVVSLSEEEKRDFLLCTIEQIKIDWDGWKKLMKAAKTMQNKLFFDPHLRLADLASPPTGKELLEEPPAGSPKYTITTKHWVFKGFYQVHWDIEAALRWFEEKFGDQVKAAAAEVEKGEKEGRKKKIVGPRAAAVK